MGLAKPSTCVWYHAIKPAYTDGKANFLDENGELVCGIYDGLENEVYHSLAAYSSSLIKELCKNTPAHVFRNYFSDIERKRTLQQNYTLDTGTLGHALILEPEIFNETYFRLPLETEYPNALTTAEDLKKKCAELGLKVTGTKEQLVSRIIEQAPSTEVFDDIVKKTLIKGAGAQAVEAAVAATKQKKCSSVIRGFELDEVKALAKRQPVDGLVWNDAQRILNTFQAHPKASRFVCDGFAELTVIARCPETGLLLKAKFDYINKMAVASDVKTTRSANPYKFRNQCRELRYDVQESFYRMVANLAGIPCNTFAFLAIEYAEADICEVFEISERRYVQALNDTRQALETLKHCLENDEWHGYTRHGEVMMIDW